jgi:hypothetical protein
MKAFNPLLLAASLLAAGTCAAFPVDLTTDDRTELRGRAERLQTDRAQGMVRAADTVPLDRPQGDVHLDRDRGEVKAGKRSAEVKPHQNRGTKTAKKSKKRSITDLPGALVH